MKVLTVEPRSPEWHDIRNESWTASTAAVLCVEENAILLRDFAAKEGVTLDIQPLLDVGIKSFYGNTLWKAWADKMGQIPRFKGNADTERGVRNEVKVVENFEDNEMLVTQKDVTALSSILPWMLASFDAVAPASSDTTVAAPYGFPVEAKCPAFNSRKKLWDSKKAGNLAVMGLPYYWCQVQHQIAVAEAPYGWFIAAGVEPDAEGVEQICFPIAEKVPRDERFLLAYVAAAQYYHERFIAQFAEPPKVASDIELLEKLAEEATINKALADNDTSVMADLYVEAIAKATAAKARVDELEAKLLSTAKALIKEGETVLILSPQVSVTEKSSETMSWQKLATDLAKTSGEDLSELKKKYTSEKTTMKVVVSKAIPTGV